LPTNAQSTFKYHPVTAEPPFTVDCMHFSDVIVSVAEVSCYLNKAYYEYYYNHLMAV